MKLIKTLISVQLIVMFTGCAATKNYREKEERISSEQKTLDNTSFVQIMNNTNNKITISYNGIPELTDSNKSGITTFSPGNQNPTTFAMGMTYTVNSLSSKEEKMIKIRKDDSIKIKYKKANREIEENLKISNDLKLQITDKGIIPTKMLK